MAKKKTTQNDAADAAKAIVEQTSETVAETALEADAAAQAAKPKRSRAKKSEKAQSDAKLEEANESTQAAEAAEAKAETVAEAVEVVEQTAKPKRSRAKKPAKAQSDAKLEEANESAQAAEALEATSKTVAEAVIPAKEPVTDSPIETAEEPISGEQAAETAQVSDKPLEVTAEAPTDGGNKKKRKKWPFILLGILVVIGLAVYFVLNMRIGSGGDAIEDEWKTPSYLSEKTMNILVCGIDTDLNRTSNEMETNTDVIIVANMDFEKNAATLLQIPRDTCVGEDLVEYGKINGLYERGTAGNRYGDAGIASGGNGMKLLINVINDQFKLPIDKYVCIDMEGFRKAVDMLGGVDITITEQMVFETVDEEGNPKEIILEPGTHTLDGEMSDLFVRYRDGYITQDIQRIDVQRYFMAALLNKALAAESKDIASLVSAVYPYLTTDLTLGEITSLAFKVKNMSADSIAAVRAPGEGVAGYGEKSTFVFSLHKEALAQLLNDSMRPYSDDVPADELNVLEIANTTDYLDEDETSLGQYGALIE